MRNVALVALVAALAVTATASRAEGDSAKPEEKLVCKKQQQTGTRFGKRICHTAAQWDEISEAHRRTMAETINRPQIEIRHE